MLIALIPIVSFLIGSTVIAAMLAASGFDPGAVYDIEANYGLGYSYRFNYRLTHLQAVEVVSSLNRDSWRIRYAVVRVDPREGAKR